MFWLINSHLQAYSLQVKSQDAVHTLGSKCVYISEIFKPNHLPRRVKFVKYVTRRIPWWGSSFFPQSHTKINRCESHLSSSIPNSTRCIPCEILRQRAFPWGNRKHWIHSGVTTSITSQPWNNYIVTGPTFFKS